MTPRAFSRPDTQLHEATHAVSFADLLANAASLERCVVIVPTATHRRAALIRLAHSLNTQAPETRSQAQTGGVQVFTLQSFAQYVLQSTSATSEASSLRLLARADASMLFRAAARSIGQRPGSLDFTIDRLLRWKSEGLTPDDIEDRACDEFAPRHLRILDRYARMWRAYESVKGPKGADPVDVLLHAAQRDMSELIGKNIDRVIVWQPHALALAEANFMRNVGVHASVAILWAESSDVGLVRERSTDVIRWGWDEDVNVNASSVYTPVTHDTQIHAEHSRLDEVRRILASIKTSSLDARDVCIIVPGDRSYKRLLQGRAMRAGVPLAVDGQRALHTTGVALTLRAACDVVSGHWRRTDLERLLRSGFVTTEAVNLGALLRAAASQRIVGGSGADEWGTRLRQRREVMRRLLEQEPDNITVQQTLSELDAAMQALAWLRPILQHQPAGTAATNTYESASTPMAAPAFSQLLTTFLQRLGIARKATALEAEATRLGLPCAEREALVSIEALTERYAVLSRESTLPAMSVADHTTEWWQLVRAMLVRTPDMRLDGIPVLTPDEARGRTWELVLAPGFAEGEFPKRDHDPLEHELLPDAAARRYRCALDDILHAVSASGTLVLTYPKQVDNADVLPSSYLDSIQAHHEHARAVDALPVRESIILDPFELAALSGKGLVDVADRQRASLHDVKALDYVKQHVDQPLSASRLDTVADCPYKFFAQRILGLRSESESNDTLSGLERGAMMHEIARRFYERVRGTTVVPFTNAQELLATCVQLEPLHKHEYMQKLLEIYTQVSQQYDTDHTYAQTEQRAIIGTPERPGLLYRWLAHELKHQTATTLRPALFEFEFDVVVDGEAVRGRVDRVDVAPFTAPDGSAAIQFSIVDYKSTKQYAPTIKSVTMGEAMQMPLYVAAVQTAFAERGIPSVAAQALYRTFGKSMKSVEDPTDVVVLKEPSAEQMQELFNVIHGHVETMRAEEYPVAPAPKACERCDYADVCRIASWGALVTT